jgi:hypothetical protein
VAEEALGQIEERANDVLAECGVDLRLEVRWARTGKGLARACDACGHPFPASARVKACERCGAERGPLDVNELTVEMSRRSGALEDLGGIALQLAAADWLRAERESPWRVAVLDEPVASLDRAHRRMFGAHLAAVLRRSASQSLVIAHDASVLDSLPGRIQITSDGRWAKAEVVA